MSCHCSIFSSRDGASGHAGEIHTLVKPQLLNMSSSAGWSCAAGLRAAPDQTRLSEADVAVPEAGGHHSSGHIELLDADWRRAMGNQAVANNDGCRRYRNCAWRVDGNSVAHDEVRAERLAVGE